MKKLLSYLLPISQFVTLGLVLVLLLSGSSQSFGGTTNYDALDVTDGYYVDGTQVIDGSGNFIGAVSSANSLTVTGDVRLKSPVESGASSTLSGTTTTVITAAQACDNSFVAFSPSITEASTLNLPTTQALFADCLTTNGDSVRLYGQNKTASTTVVTVGNASTTLVYQGSTGGSATLAASSWIELTFIRVTDVLMVAIMDQFKP